MIDTDKMRAAYAATPLCQSAWTKKDGNNPTMLCAISAMVSYAGVQPDLIDKMVDVLGAERWFSRFASPVLESEYGMPHDVACEVPALFDHQENEWRGVQAVLDLCERHNMNELHLEAISEDRWRFPQYGPATSDDKSAPFRGEYYYYKSIVMDGCFLATPTKTKTAKQKPEQAPLGLLDIMSGESALDGYWKLTGHAPLLWTANVLPEIKGEFCPGPLVVAPSAEQLAKFALT